MPQSDVVPVPVGFDFDGEFPYLGGMNLLKSTKFRNVLKNNKFAIVVDILKSIDPWDPRGVRICSTVDIVTHQGDYLENTDQPNPHISVLSPIQDLKKMGLLLLQDNPNSQPDSGPKGYD